MGDGSENPHLQHHTGETYFQTEAPIDPSRLSHWRKRVGEEGVEMTVMPKAVSLPTDSRLLEKSRQHLVTLAKEEGLTLRQNYNRGAPRLAAQIGVALDESKAENGCPRVTPGSHRDRVLLPHLRETRTDVVLNQRTEDSAFDAGQVVDIELEPEQMSMHDAYMIHEKAANRSTKRRAGVAIRYMPSTSRFDRTLMKPGDGSRYTVDFSTRPLWLVGGGRDGGMISRSGIGGAAQESGNCRVPGHPSEAEALISIR